MPTMRLCAVIALFFLLPYIALAAAKDKCEDLLYAAKTGNVKTMRALLDFNKLYVNTCISEDKETEGASPLMIAAAEGRLDAVEMLIADGAKVNHDGVGDFNALMLASGGGHDEIVKALLAAGADIDNQSVEGLTALMFAVYRKRVQVVKTLLNAGADKRLVGENGISAFMLANEVGDPTISRWLLHDVEQKKWTDEELKELMEQRMKKEIDRHERELELMRERALDEAQRAAAAAALAEKRALEKAQEKEL